LKRHQIRFYLRMRDIEVREYGHISGKDRPDFSENVGQDTLHPSPPLIDSS